MTRRWISEVPSKVVSWVVGVYASRCSALTCTFASSTSRRWRVFHPVVGMKVGMGTREVRALRGCVRTRSGSRTCGPSSLRLTAQPVAAHGADSVSSGGARQGMERRGTREAFACRAGCPLRGELDHRPRRRPWRIPGARPGACARPDRHRRGFLDAVTGERRTLRITASFFEDLDRQLGAERGPNGEPSVNDFQVFELLRVVEVFATRWDELPALIVGRSDYRILIASGLLVPPVLGDRTARSRRSGRTARARPRHGVWLGVKARLTDVGACQFARAPSRSLRARSAPVDDAQITDVPERD
jgi:hypothetical protein